MTVIWKIWSEPLTHLFPTGWGGQKPLLGTSFELWPNLYLQWNKISTTRKKLVNLQGLPYMPHKFCELGPEMAENGWRVFAHRYIFTLGDTDSLTARILYNK